MHAEGRKILREPDAGNPPVRFDEGELNGRLGRSAPYSTSTYADFVLPADMDQVNIIEIRTDQLSVANLKGAITAAAGKALPDLVVVRTSDTQNTITYASWADALAIDIPATQGAISIVGFGSRPLTLDAAQTCRLIYIWGQPTAPPRSTLAG